MFIQFCVDILVSPFLGALTWVMWLMWHRYTMSEDFSMVVDQELFQMILLDLLPQAQILIGGVLALGVRHSC